VDFETCRARAMENAARRWSRSDLESGAGYQNRLTDRDDFERWFYTDFFDDLHEIEPIPAHWRDIV
jgi:hypothetical protein